MFVVYAYFSRLFCLFRLFTLCCVLVTSHCSAQSQCQIWLPASCFSTSCAVPFRCALAATAKKILNFNVDWKHQTLNGCHCVHWGWPLKQQPLLLVLLLLLNTLLPKTNTQHKFVPISPTQARSYMSSSYLSARIRIKHIRLRFTCQIYLWIWSVHTKLHRIVHMMKVYFFRGKIPWLNPKGSGRRQT